MNRWAFSIIECIVYAFIMNEYLNGTSWTRRNTPKFQPIFFQKPLVLIAHIFNAECAFYSLSFPQFSKRLFLNALEYGILKKNLHFYLVWSWHQNNVGLFLLFYFSLPFLCSVSLHSFVVFAFFFLWRGLHYNIFIFGKNNTALILHQE